MSPLIMLRPLALATLIGLAALPAIAADSVAPPSNHWSFQGGLNNIFGTFDRATLQRGFQVYDQVCASCHSMSLLSYRNLAERGGPEFSLEAVKAIAAEKSVIAGPDQEGDMYERPGLPSDHFVSPFPNDNAARAANDGALPPDLSLIVKARPGGADYLDALLTGYRDPPDNLKIDDSLYFNIHYKGYRIKMPQPLYDDLITYDDGTPVTVKTMSYDVTAFLSWAAETHLEERRRLGFIAMIMIAILAGLLYFSTQRVWHGKHNH